MDEIVVGVDLSEHSAEALRWAARESDLRDTPLAAVMVWSYLDQHVRNGSGGFDPGYGADQAERDLTSFVADTLGPDRAATTRCRVTCDLPTPGLRAEAAQASLLVLGARGLGGFKELLVGSVSQQLLHHPVCPVAIVRAGPTPTAESAGERVVVGVDDSAPARAALRWAAREARYRHATLEVVHSWMFPYVGGYPFAPGTVDVAGIEEGARAVVDRMIEAEVDSPSELEIRRSVVNGAPAQTVLGRAEGADLVVLGTRGAGGFAGLLLGSTTHQVTHHATCPVVVIPALR